MKTKQIFLYGYKGTIVRLHNDSVKASLVEVDNNFLSQDNQVGQFSFSSACELDFLELKIKLSDIYRDWGRFGYMGDVIAVKSININFSWVYTIDFIGRLAVHKPVSAVDLLLLINTGFDEYYFVGIERRFNPGKGLPAFMGGFIDVNGYHLDTPLETAIHEAKEEIGLDIKVINHDDLKNPLPTESRVSVEYKGKEFKSTLRCYGVIPTGDNEKMPSIGLKRVYQTTVYSLILDMSSVGMTESDIRNWLKAGDDAAKIFVADIYDEDKLRFGIDHHQKIFDSFIEGVRMDR